MDAFVGHTLSVFMGFFAIMNPIANTPVFLGLTAGDDPATQRKIAAKALIVSFVITFFFFVSGERFVKYIGDNGIKVITRLMGLILAVIGVQMLIHGIGGAVTDFQGLAAS
jgi:multiple antibiotic resistance protein